MRASFWRKLRKWLGDRKWILVGLGWLVSLVLGYVGFDRYFDTVGEISSFWDKLYPSLQLFVLESGSVSGPIGWQLELARFLAPVVAVYTAIQALAVVLKEQLKIFGLRFLKNQVVICGLGRKGFLLCRGFLERGKAVVVVEQDSDNSMIGICEELGATVLVGNAADPELLRLTRIEKASCVISVCGDDGANAEVAINTRRLVAKRKGKPLSCLIHLSDLQLRNLLREREIMMGRPDAITLGFFNVFESGSRVMLEQYPPFTDYGGKEITKPHIVVVGIGRMGESLLVNVARMWWKQGSTNNGPLRITMIDREANQRRESLSLRYPRLDKDCQLIPVQMEIRSPEFEQAGFLFDSKGRCHVTRVYICLDDDSKSLGAALTLRQWTMKQQIPIVVRMTQDTGLAVLLGGAGEGEDFVDLHAFGLLDRTCTPELVFKSTHEILARAIHQEYIKHMKDEGFNARTKTSMAPWDELPENLRDSNRAMAEHISVKLKAVGCDIALTNDWQVAPFKFSVEEVELMARMEHDRWLKSKLQLGWRYGPNRDDQARIHPCLVDWDELPKEEREKDRVIVRSMPKLLAGVGFKIYRSG